MKAELTPHQEILCKILLSLTDGEQAINESAVVLHEAIADTFDDMGMNENDVKYFIESLEENLP